MSPVEEVAVAVERLHEFLLTHGVAYRTHRHRRVYEAQEVASVEHVSGHDVAKPVLVLAGDELVMVVVPASHEVDLEAVARELDTPARLAAEREFGDRFPDCELGAEPALGNLYGIWVLLDQRMTERERLVCRDGSHEETIELAVADYLDLVHPRIVDVAVPARMRVSASGR